MYIYVAGKKNGVMAIAVLFIGQLILPTNELRSIARKRWAFFIIWRLSLYYWLSCITTHAARAIEPAVRTVEPICHRHKTVTMNHVKMALRCFNPIMVLARCCLADIYIR